MRRTADIAPSYALEAGHPEDVLARCVQILTNDGHLATSLPDVGSALWRHDNREQGAMTNDAGNAAQWHFPDSDICSAAMQLAFDVSPEFLANHCVRSYLFARELAATNGLRSGVDYDDELVFLGCILHDLGVTDYGGRDQRFEVDGADAAVRFLRAQESPMKGPPRCGRHCSAHQRWLGEPIRPRTVRLALRNQPGH